MNLLSYLRITHNETNQSAAKRINISYVRYNAITKEPINPFDRLYYREVLHLCKVYHIPTIGQFNEKQFTQDLFNIIQEEKIYKLTDIFDYVSQHNLQQLFIKKQSPLDVLKLKEIEELCILLDCEYEKPALKQSIIETGDVHLNHKEILGVEQYA